MDTWRVRHGVTSDEARIRFMQFAVLDCLAAAPIGRSLVFKGGNALRFLYQSPRSTIDLDFTALPAFPDDADEIRVLIDAALTTGSRRFGFAARTQRVKRRPPASTATMPTYDIAVGSSSRRIDNTPYLLQVCADLGPWSNSKSASMTKSASTPT